MDYDVLVIGAGTSGAAAARACAQKGLRVLTIDRRPLEDAGARWVNGVPARGFDEAGIARPIGDELLGEDHAFHLIAGFGGPRIVMREHGVLEVDMRKLVARLQQDAKNAGAEFRGDTHAFAITKFGVETNAGRVNARTIIDASGIGGAGLVQLPTIAREHLCAAAQEVREIANRSESEAFFRANSAAPGDLLCFTSIAGGYSIVNVRSDGDHISLLTGSIPARGFPSGQTLLSNFVAEQSWIGKTIFGGARAIPLRRPFDRLVYGRVALLGDAGCQVFSAHGSGIASGMYAARVLAETIARGEDLENYAVKWMRSRGGLHAAYDLFRRFSATLSVDDLEKMIAGSILTESLGRAGLLQEMARPSPREMISLARAITKEPLLGARLLATVTKMQALFALYSRYPREPRERRVWGKAVAAIFGEPADQIVD